MMKIWLPRFVFAAAIAGLPVHSAVAQSATDARLSIDVKTLSSDEFEGRGPGSVGERKTVDYIISQMKSAGLSAGGDVLHGKRGWTQAVPLLQADIVGKPQLTLTTDDNRNLALTQGKEIAVRAALNGADHIALRNVPLIFVGYGVTAPECHWDDFKDVDVRGKILVFLINDPDFESGKGDFGGKAMTYYGRWKYKYEEALRRGAVGALIVHETVPAAYGWDTIRNSYTNSQFDVGRRNPATTHLGFEGWIQRDLAVSLFKQAGLDFEAQKAIAQSRAFRPLDLKATMSTEYRVTSSRVVSQNVVGMLAGRKHPNETVLYSAHWDHLGIGVPDAKGDRIYNGAVDNATGVAALLELGRIFAKARRTDRSVVFLAWAAEEKGLLGSEYYADNPLFPLATTVGMINMDSLDTSGAAHNFSIAGTARLDLLDRLIAVGARQSRYFSPDPHPEAGNFYRSDHFSLAKRGVPALSFSSGIDLIDGGVARGEAESEAYNRLRYHQPADEWSSTMRWDGITQDVRLLAAFGKELSDGRDWPNWAPNSEFRAARDATASARR